MRRGGRFRSVVVVMVVFGLLVPPGARGADPPVAPVLEGLQNPRGIAVHDGQLYVAEAGRGAAEPGEGSCVEVVFHGGEQVACGGNTGALTVLPLVPGASPSRISGFPSIADETGAGAVGPHDVAVVGGEPHLLTGQGISGVPVERPHWFHSLLRLEKTRVDHLAHLGVFERDHNPDSRQVDSNPYSLLASEGSFTVADAGANAILVVDGQGTRVRNVLPPIVAAGQADIEPVPTSVARDNQGNLYVSELGGFPFLPGTSRIWRFDAGTGAGKVVHEGFTAVIDITVADDGTLYVLEFARAHVLAAGPTGGMGALWRVGTDGRRTELHRGVLVEPGGIALHGGAAYVTVRSTSPGEGAVLRLSL